MEGVKCIMPNLDLEKNFMNSFGGKKLEETEESTPIQSEGSFIKIPTTTGEKSVLTNIMLLPSRHEKLLILAEEHGFVRKKKGEDKLIGDKSKFISAMIDAMWENR